MDTLYMFANSFKNSAFLNRNFVDWNIELVVACICGAGSSYYFGNNGYSWALAQYIYLNRYASKMISPIFRMLKDGPLGDEVEELTLQWVRYGTFVASFHAVWFWGHVWTTVKELPFYYLGLVTLILCGSIHWLFFRQFSVLDRAYVKYREVEGQILFRRSLLLSKLWSIVRPIAKKCSKSVRSILTRLGIGVSVLPDVLEKPDSHYIYEKMVTGKEFRLLRLAPNPISRVIRCYMEHHLLNQSTLR